MTGLRLLAVVLPIAWSAWVVVSAWRLQPRRWRRPRGRSHAWPGSWSRPWQRPRHAAPHPQRRFGRRGADRRAERARVVEAVPDVVDLFAVAVAAGLNVRLAVAAVASRAPPGPVADALGRVEAEVGAGRARLADTLERLPAWLGEPIRPLSRALVDAERYGAPLGASLDRIAEESRRARQQRAQEAARRVPVHLLLPLVACILPAFGLLTVAPLIAGGLRALRL